MKNGEPVNSKPFGLLLKGFLFFLNYFTKKEGFLNKLVVCKKSTLIIIFKLCYSE